MNIVTQGQMYYKHDHQVKIEIKSSSKLQYKHLFFWFRYTLICCFETWWITYPHFSVPKYSYLFTPKIVFSFHIMVSDPFVFIPLLLLQGSRVTVSAMEKASSGYWQLLDQYQIFLAMLQKKLTRYVDALNFYSLKYY